MGSHPLLMVDGKVYYSQREYIQQNKNGFTPFANGGCQSLLNGFTPFANGGCQSLLQYQEYIATFAESICIL